MYTPKGLWCVDQSKLDQGQERKLIEMLNVTTWPKGTRGGDCNGYTFKLFLHMI